MDKYEFWKWIGGGIVAASTAVIAWLTIIKDWRKSRVEARQIKAEQAESEVDALIKVSSFNATEIIRFQKENKILRKLVDEQEEKIKGLEMLIATKDVYITNLKKQLTLWKTVKA